MSKRFCVGVVLMSGFVAAPVSAHLGLDDPPSRYGQTVLKTAPCGMAGGARSANVTTFEAGQTITVKWNEYINHPGHYRISFDDDGDDDFVEPACLSNCDNRNMEIELYSNAAVLLDGIADAAGGDYTAEITLPDVVCDNCTLQVIQVMTDKPPYTLGGNDLYYQCADLVLVPASGTPDMGTPSLDMGANNATPDMGPSGTTNTPIPDVGSTQNNDPDAGNPSAPDAADQADKADEGGCSTAVSSNEGALWSALWCFGLVGLSRRRRRAA